MRQSARCMTESITHRGRDGSGYWNSQGVALGHRRLSIIDVTEKGSQPMVSPCGRYIIVYNGEVYNYAELKKQCMDRGYHFSSSTDTEVVLALYSIEGQQAVLQMEGMFAFAVYDTKRKTLFLARDRVGEKPLYYAHSGSHFAFCSEIQGLRKLHWVRQDIDPKAVQAIMAHQSLPSPLTMFEGIRSLPPATYGILKGHSLGIESYWSLDFSKRRGWTWPDAIEAYEDQLAKSVSGCLMSDVPLGLTLSGGVDSSAVAVVARPKVKNLRSFCIGYSKGEQEDPEQILAEKVSGHIGTTHQSIQCVQPSLDQFIRLVPAYGQPIWSTAITYADTMAASIAQHLKVALTGGGADEVLGGYRSYRTLRIEGMARNVLANLPHFFCSAIGSLGGERFYRLMESTNGNDFTDWRANSFDNAMQDLGRKVLTGKWRKKLADYDAGFYIRKYANECNPSNYMDTVLYSDLMVAHQHGHNIIPDISGMRHGVEFRSPFLSHRLMELAASFPQKLLIGLHNGSLETKLIAKRHLLKYLPKEVVWVKKMGFGYSIPVNDMLAGRNKKRMEDLLLGGRYLDLGIFSKEGATWALANSRLATWMLISFAVWAEYCLINESSS